MIYDSENAERIANAIIERYGNGIPFIETEWRGSPNLELGDILESFTRQAKTHINYECLSNDITYNGGLKVKTKARAKKITAS